MAEKDLETDDPYEFVAMRYPVGPGSDPDATMARCFIEEYALMGMPREKTMRLFQSPYFAGTHAILQRRGDAFVQDLINDVYGHAAGDAVLIQTTQRLRASLAPGELFARIGGDEFLAVKPFTRENEIEEFAARIADAFSRPNELGKATFQTSASIGIAVYPRDGDNIDELTMRADLAMYRSKKSQPSRKYRPSSNLH